jgi:hypothetical protein
VITFSAVSKFYLLNLSLFITEGSDFCGFVFPGFTDKPAPFLQPEGWNQYVPLLVQGLCSVSFGKDGKIPVAFSTIYNGREQSTWVGNN